MHIWSPLVRPINYVPIVIHTARRSCCGACFAFEFRWRFDGQESAVCVCMYFLCWLNVNRSIETNGFEIFESIKLRSHVWSCGKTFEGIRGESSD